MLLRDCQGIDLELGLGLVCVLRKIEDGGWCVVLMGDGGMLWGFIYSISTALGKKVRSHPLHFSALLTP